MLAAGAEARICSLLQALSATCTRATANAAVAEVGDNLEGSGSGGVRRKGQTASTALTVLHLVAR